MPIPNAEDLRDPNAAAITNALNSITTHLQGIETTLAVIQIHLAYCGDSLRSINQSTGLWISYYERYLRNQ